MSVNVREKIRHLNSTQRRKVTARAVELIAEEMSLRDLRKARKLTQVSVARVLGVTQDSVSRLEKRSDLLLSTLRKTVRAMGGDVRFVAEFPDRAPVVLFEDNLPWRKIALRETGTKIAPKSRARTTARRSGASAAIRG
ncbi:MAG TPA: helix-turn-helix transcriptional regulator [Candidatus Dormibacteraeota bacterium]|nr:helix-turn-helix transcriptional regulator [Candidatus Dormibacteraeota bacterium]